MWWAPIISGVTSLFKGKQDLEKLKVSGKQKLAIGKELSQAEWESLGVRGGDGSLKDEYVTFIVTLPIPFIFVGNLVAVFTGNTKVLEANSASLSQLGTLMDTTYGQLMVAVCLAAIGIKWSKGLFK